MIVRTVINLWNWMSRQGFPCLFRRLTGLYCPGCGGTRALRYLLQGQVMKSLYYNPLVVYMAAVGAAEGILWIVSRRRGEGKPSRRPYEMEIYVGIGVAAVNWVVKNGVVLMGGGYLIP